MSHPHGQGIGLSGGRGGLSDTSSVGLVRVNHDGCPILPRRAWRDNIFVERLWRSVKCEEVYLHAYDSVSAARKGLARYFRFYNNCWFSPDFTNTSEKPHTRQGGVSWNHGESTVRNLSRKLYVV